MSASQRTQNSVHGTESGPKKQTVKWGVEMSLSPTRPRRGTQSWLTGEAQVVPALRVSPVVTWENVLVMGNAVTGSMM